MNILRRRLEAAGRRLSAPDTCPEHRVGMPPGSDWRSAFRSTLRAFSPDPEDRAAYRREQDALAVQPACERCGWRPTPIYMETPDHWGQYGPADGSDAA